jgi:hypothetical protein
MGSTAATATVIVVVVVIHREMQVLGQMMLASALHSMIAGRGRGVWREGMKGMREEDEGRIEIRWL